MAHPQQIKYFEVLSRHYPEMFRRARVAEVGSLDINGSVRQCFSECTYVGYDLELGPGVDVAEQGQLIGAATASFDTVVSAECFEHNPYWVETFANMLRISAPGGLVASSCASLGRQEHGTARTEASDSPFTESIGWTYYKNLVAEDFIKSFNLAGWFSAYHFLYCPQVFDLYFYGVRRPANGQFDESRFISAADAIELELQNSTQTVRIGRWTDSTGWAPRLKWMLP
jgi:SAM-dependent methyltransferase